MVPNCPLLHCGAKLSYTQVDIMILVKAAEINPGGDMTVLKRRQCAKINGVWNSSTPTKISLLSIFHTQYIGKH